MLEMKQGRDDEAVKCLHAAVELNPNLAQAHRSLGIAFSKLEEMDAAEASYRRALAIEPESEECPARDCIERASAGSFGDRRATFLHRARSAVLRQRVCL